MLFNDEVLSFFHGMKAHTFPPGQFFLLLYLLLCRPFAAGGSFLYALITRNVSPSLGVKALII